MRGDVVVVCGDGYLPVPVTPGFDMNKSQPKRVAPKPGTPGLFRNLLFLGFCLCVAWVLGEAKWLGRLLISKGNSV